MKFTVTGTIDQGGKRTFTKTVEAASENHARERVLALFGAQNGLVRSAIAIAKVQKG